MRTSKDKEKILKYLKIAEIVAAIEKRWREPVPANKLRGLQRKIQRELEKRPSYNPLVGHKLAANKLDIFMASLGEYLEEKTYAGIKTYEQMTEEIYVDAQDATADAHANKSDTESDSKSDTESDRDFDLSPEVALEKLYKACVIAQARALFPNVDFQRFLDEMNELEWERVVVDGRFKSGKEELHYLELEDRVAEALLGNLEVYSKEA